MHDFDFPADKGRDTTATNGHTITGDPGHDGPIDWDAVRTEVGE